MNKHTPTHEELLRVIKILAWELQTAKEAKLFPETAEDALHMAAEAIAKAEGKL